MTEPQEVTEKSLPTSKSLGFSVKGKGVSAEEKSGKLLPMQQTGFGHTKKLHFQNEGTPAQ